MKKILIVFLVLLKINVDTLNNKKSCCNIKKINKVILDTVKNKKVKNP